MFLMAEIRGIVKVYLPYMFSAHPTMEDQAVLPGEDEIREALRSVDDPEVGMNIVDLGLVYRIDIEPERVHVEMTMTTPACPMTGLITEDAQRALTATVPPGCRVDIELVWEPPWSPQLMSETAKLAFGWTS